MKFCHVKQDKVSFVQGAQQGQLHGHGRTGTPTGALGDKNQGLGNTVPTRWKHDEKFAFPNSVRRSRMTAASQSLTNGECVQPSLTARGTAAVRSMVRAWRRWRARRQE